MDVFNDWHLPFALYGLLLVCIRLAMEAKQAEEIVSKDTYPLGFRALHGFGGQLHGYIPSTKKSPENDPKYLERRKVWIESITAETRTVFALAQWVHMSKAEKDSYSSKSPNHAIYADYLNKLLDITAEDRNKAQLAFNEASAAEYEERRARVLAAEMERKACGGRVKQFKLEQWRLQQEEAARKEAAAQEARDKRYETEKDLVVYRVYVNGQLVGEYDRREEAWDKYKQLLGQVYKYTGLPNDPISESKKDANGNIVSFESIDTPIDSIYEVEIRDARGKNPTTLSMPIHRSTMDRAEDTIAYHFNDPEKIFIGSKLATGDLITYILGYGKTLQFAKITKKPYINRLTDANRVAAYRREAMRAHDDQMEKERRAQIEMRRIKLEEEQFEKSVEESKKALNEDYDKLLTNVIQESEADQEARMMKIVDYYSNEDQLRVAAEKRKKLEHDIEAMLDEEVVAEDDDDTDDTDDL